MSLDPPLLSHDFRLDVEEFNSSIDDSIKVTRAKFEKMARPILDRIKDILFETLAKADFTSANLNKVLLVGGGSRMPMIRDLLLSMFSNADYCCTQNPDEVVAIGAAQYAYCLATQSSSNCLIM